jgi:predicted unusual protein kinase regulating ubiquinone biosynthesis (AarF/ABC1/UbiB family)/ribosomal protein L7/L12
MRADQLRREVASRVSAVTVELPTSLLGRPARLIAGLTRASTRSLGRALRRRVGRARDSDVEPEAAIVASLGRLKGVAMQMGQLFGSVDVGLPADLRTALSVLHTHAQPLPLGRIRAVLEADLGDAGRELARAIDGTPLSVAPLGQVHRATLSDGTAVAVKVLYPGIGKTIARDFVPATVTSRVATWIYPRAHLDRVVREVRAGVLEECDCALEAERQERFAALFAAHPTLIIPPLHRALCSSRVLTTTLVAGLHLEDYLATTPSAEARQRAGEALFDFYLGALFRDGLYCCDPHPGNFRFLPDGGVAILDFASVRELAPGFVARLAALTRALVADDGERLRQAVAELGLVADAARYDHESTRWLLRALFGPLLRDEVTRFEFLDGTPLREMARRWRRARHLALPAELVFLLRASFGLSSVLGRLGVRANWHRRLQAMLATPSSPPDHATPLDSPRLADESARGESVAAYDVVLVDPGSRPIALVRELRELTGLELRDLEILLDSSPQIIQSALPTAAARVLRQRLESAGARVELRLVSRRGSLPS